MISISRKWFNFLAGGILFLMVFGGGQAYLILQLHQERKALMQSIGYLERSIDEEKIKLHEEFSEMQRKVLHQHQENLVLKTQLSQLEKKHHHLNRQFHEKQAFIFRINDADSIYREIARHYRK